MSGISTAAGTGSSGTSRRRRASPGSNKPGISQSSRACRGTVPARRARMMPAQSRGAAPAVARSPFLGASGIAPAVSGTSASATASSLDAAGRELGGIEQLLELCGREIGHLRCHLADRTSLGVSLLGDGGALLVANYRIECGDEDWVPV